MSKGRQLAKRLRFRPLSLTATASSPTAWWKFWGMGRDDRQPAAELPEALAWVDEFIANIRPYVVVRVEDNLLIRMPNVASQLNPVGARILHHLLSGGTAAELAAKIGGDERQLADVCLFLHDVRRYVAGDLREDNASRAVEVRPLGLHFSEFPVLAELALTGRCNLRCAFCYAGCADSPRSSGDQLSEADVKKLLRRVRREALVPSISFTGGEPTLRGDLPELVRHAAQNLGMRVNLITNGTLVDERLAAELAAAGLASAQVSVEAPEAAVHDAITGVPGSFELSLAAISHFRRHGVNVHANTTINRHNLDVVQAMPEFTRDILGLERFSMNMVIPAGSAAANAAPDTPAASPLLRYGETATVVMAVRQAAERAGVEFMWYSPTPLCIFNPITAALGNKGCSACDGLLSIDARGRLLPCSSCDEPLGDLLKEDFHAIWHSARAKRYRGKDFAPPGCRECEHFAFCHGACPLYWRQFGHAELPGQPHNDLYCV